MTVHVGLRWWAQPMMWAALLFAFVMQPWMDDEDRARLAGNLAAFIAKRGIVLRQGQAF
jgi:hypothetical protein